MILEYEFQWLSGIFEKKNCLFLFVQFFFFDEFSRMLPVLLTPQLFFFNNLESF